MTGSFQLDRHGHYTRQPLALISIGLRRGDPILRQSTMAQVLLILLGQSNTLLYIPVVDGVMGLVTLR